MHNFFVFSDLANKETLLKRYPNLFKVLEDTLVQVSDGKLNILIQKKLVTEVGMVYLHFGFCALSPYPREIFAKSLAKETGTDENLVLLWLETICYQVLDDLAILQLAEGEPDWNLLDRSFKIELCKRIFCVEESEYPSVGCDLWNSQLVHMLRETTSFILKIIQKNADADFPFSSSEIEKLGPLKHFQEALELCFYQIQEEPLSLLTWRIESFSLPSHLDEGIFALKRVGTPNLEALSRQLSGVVALFLPFFDEQKNALFPESPLSAYQLWQNLYKDEKRENFDTETLVKWVQGSPCFKEFTFKDFREILQKAEQYQLLFKVPKGKQVAYGLTKMALKMLEPYRMTLINAICKTPNAILLPSNVF